MRAPKHLWAGDWERESAAVSEDLAALEELPRVSPEPRSGQYVEPRLGARPEPVRASAPRPEPPGATVPRRTIPPIRLPRINIPAVSRRTRRNVAVALTAMLVLAACVYGLVSLVGSSGS